MAKELQDWERMQMKAFRNWANYWLKRNGHEEIVSLYKEENYDLSDGLKLINLATSLTRKELEPGKKPKAAAKLRIQKAQNVNLALDHLRNVGKMDNISNVQAEDIVDGNARFVLGLFWTMIQRFQINPDGEEDNFQVLTKDELLQWVREYLAGYDGVEERLKSFPKGTQDGVLFQYLVHRKDGSVDLDEMKDKSPVDRMNEAFENAEAFGVPWLLDAEDVAKSPEEKSIFTYLATFRAYALADQSAEAEEVVRHKSSAAKIGTLVSLNPKTWQDIDLQGETLLGRHVDCHPNSQYTDGMISGKHCRFYEDNGKVFVEDTSSNGTFVNGELLGKGNSQQLHSTDIVSLVVPDQESEHFTQETVIYQFLPAGVSELDALREQIAALKARIVELETENEELREARKRELEEIKKLRADLENTVKERKTADEEAARVKKLSEDLEEVTRELNALKKQLKEERSAKEKAIQELAVQEVEVQKLKKLEDDETERSAKSKESLKKVVKEQEIMEERTQWEMQKKKMSEEMDDLKRIKEQDHSELVSEIKKLNDENAKLNRENEDLKDENTRLRDDNTNLKDENANLMRSNPDAQRNRNLMDIELIIRELYYRRGARISYALLREMHEEERHLEDVCHDYRSRCKRYSEAVRQSLHNEQMSRSSKQDNSRLERQCEEMRNVRNELRETKNAWAESYNRLGELYTPKTETEVKLEEWRKRLVKLADNPAELARETNLMRYLKQVQDELNRDDKQREAIERSKRATRDARSDLESTLDNTMSELDEHWVKESTRLRDMVLGKDVADDDDDAPSNPTVVEYMVENYDFLFGDLKARPENREVHQLIAKPATFIKNEALDTTDILAKPSNYKSYAVNQIKSYAYRGYNVDLSEVKDPFVIAALLKDYLKELKEPLCTHKLYADFVRVGEQQETTKTLQELRSLIHMLPTKRRAALTVVLKLLHLVHQHSSKNGMTSADIAEVFFPLLLRPGPKERAD